jgi:tRNA nucleotidyltransferase (CCA-adding enzyme)
MSFIDDATRIMRAFRFAGRYDFRLDKVTREAVGVALEAGALGKVSQERFTEEWWAIYQEKNYQLMLSLLETNQVLTCWFGAVLPWHTAEDSESASRWTLARKWLISLKHMNEDEINLTLTKLKLSRSMLKSTHDYLHLRRALAELRDLDDLDELDGVLQNVPYFLRDIIAEQAVYREKMAIYEKARLRVRTNLNGLDIVHLGVQEGPLIGLLLRQVRRLWLHGEITNAAEEQEQLEKLIQLTGLY